MIKAYLIFDFSYCTLAITVKGALVLYKDIQRDMKLFDNIYATLAELDISKLSIIIKTEPVTSRVSVVNSYGLVHANCDPDVVRSIESLVKQLHVKEYNFIDALSILNEMHDTVILYKVCGTMYAIVCTQAPSELYPVKADSYDIITIMNRHGITDISDLSLQEYGGVTAVNSTQAQHFYLLSFTDESENVNYINIENVITEEVEPPEVEEAAESSFQEPEKPVKKSKKQKKPTKKGSVKSKKAYASKPSKVPFLIPVCLLVLGAAFGSYYYFNGQLTSTSAQLDSLYATYSQYSQQLQQQQEAESPTEISANVVDGLNKLYSFNPKNIHLLWENGTLTVYCELSKASIRQQCIVELQDLGASVSYDKELDGGFANPSVTFTKYAEKFTKTKTAIIVQMEVL